MRTMATVVRGSRLWFDEKAMDANGEQCDHNGEFEKNMIYQNENML